MWALPLILVISLTNTNANLKPVQDWELAENSILWETPRIINRTTIRELERIRGLQRARNLDIEDPERADLLSELEWNQEPACYRGLPLKSSPTSWSNPLGVGTRRWKRRIGHRKSLRKVKRPSTGDPLRPRREGFILGRKTKPTLPVLTELTTARSTKAVPFVEVRWVEPNSINVHWENVDPLSSEDLKSNMSSERSYKEIANIVLPIIVVDSSKFSNEILKTEATTACTGTSCPATTCSSAAKCTTTFSYSPCKGAKKGFFDNEFSMVIEQTTAYDPADVQIVWCSGSRGLARPLPFSLLNKQFT